MALQQPRPILVVDDDDETRAAEHAVLNEGGFRVVEARDEMPGVDGPAFAQELRMGLRHVPLVILTGARDPRHEADRCNAEAYLAKPFDSRELVQVVRRFAS